MCPTKEKEINYHVSVSQLSTSLANQLRKLNLKEIYFGSQKTGKRESGDREVVGAPVELATQTGLMQDTQIYQVL